MKPMRSQCKALGQSVFCLALMIHVSAARAHDTLVLMRAMQFAVQDVHVTAGDKVIFRNKDSVLHTVYSPKDPGSFDLGLLQKDEERSITLKKPGVYEVFCSVHPNMKMTVTVREKKKN